MKKLIVVPTYNERENIGPLYQAIDALQLSFDILVVDDSSPDQTGEVVKEIQRTHTNLHLLTREKKEGLGRAYLAGFQWGLTRGYDWIIEMDADFSHRPVDLRPMVAAMASHDFIVGSRYVEGGGTQNWGLIRKLISRGGSIYSRFILGYPLRDWTGGFNAWSRKVLSAFHFPSIQSNGYSFQIELKYKALQMGFHGTEVPILFEDRRVGQSKMSSKIFLEALYRVWLIRFAKQPEVSETFKIK